MKRFVIIVILIIISVGNATSQVRLAYCHHFPGNYTTAIIYDTLIKLKGEDWTYKNVVVPLLDKTKRLKNCYLIYYDGKMKFFKIRNNPSDEVMNALNEVAEYLEQTQAVMFGANETLNLNNIEDFIQRYRKFAIELNLEQLDLISQPPPTAEDYLIHYNLVKEQYREVPSFSAVFNAWPRQIIDDYELHKSEFEEQGITIMQYLKQEVDKILSQPLPKSTLDYGITNEDFWPIKEDDKE